MLKSKLFTVALVALCQTAFAQTTSPPSAGGQMQEIRPAPVLQRPIPEIRIEHGATPAVPDSDKVKFRVDSLRVTGQVLYSEAELIAITGFRPGGELTLADLRAMASKIADHYHRNGYFVAQAYLPAQDVKNAAVTITVLEGHYGNINLRNQTNLSNSVANKSLQGLNSGDTIAVAPLESSLLLLSDVPGVNVRSTLVPGTAVGTSDLLVDVTPGQRVSGSVEADNAGNRYTGENRVGATVNINNPLGIGDVASLRVMTTGSGLTYGRAAYQVQYGRAKVGVAYAALEYHLGKEFEPLHAHGTAEIASIFGGYTLIRSRNTNLYALIDFDARTYQDKWDIFPSPFNVVDKKAHVWMGSLCGNHRDGFGRGGVSSYSFTWSHGDLDILTPWKLADDAMTARTNGQYDKLAFNVSRLQNVTDTISLFGAINGQFASKNLDISEKMGLGGAYGVRAYPVGESYGDEGYVLNVEARLRLPKFSERMPGQMHLVGFADTGTVTINKNPWAPGENHRTLSGAGIGLTWADYNNFVLSAYWAHKLGNAAATSVPPSVDSSSRVWLQAVKFF